MHINSLNKLKNKSNLIQTMLRRVVYIAMSIVLVLCSQVYLTASAHIGGSFSTAFASNINVSSKIKDETNHNSQLVKAGIFQFDGYHNKSSEGALSGYGYDFLHMMLPYTDWEYSYVGYENSWSEAQNMLEAGEIDILTSAQKTADRLKRFDFSERPIGTSSTILTVKAGDNRFSIEDYSTLDKIRVGMVSNSSRNDSFKKYAQEHGFSYEPVYFSSTEQLTSALQEGNQIDAIVTSNLRTLNNEFILDQFDASDFYVIVKKGNQYLLDQVNYAISQMDTVNPQWRSILWNTYYMPATAEEINLTPSEENYLNEIKSKGTVFSVLVNPDKNPYAYKENGKYLGIIPEIFEQIASRVGINYEYIDVHSMDDYLKAKAQISTDLVIDLPDNIYDAEQEHYILTEPYLSMELDRLSRKDSQYPPRIAAVSNSYCYEKYGSAWESEGTVEFYENFDACAQAVVNGQCDASYLYSYQAQRTMNNDERNQLILSSLTNESLNTCIGVSDTQDHRLASILGKSIASVKDNLVSQIVMDNTLTAKRDTTFISFVYDNPVIIIIGLLVVAIIAVLIIASYFRQRRMKAIELHNKELEQNRTIIEEALSQAQSANRAKTTFLNSMSHDIRTPMNAIIGFASLAATHADDKDSVSRYLRKIITSSNHLLSLINDVLDMSRIESGKVIIEEQDCYLPDVLHDLRNIMQADIKGKRLHFFIDTVDVTTEHVICDKLRITQILLNCIGNSVKYTEPGGTVGVRVIEKPSKKKGYANFDFVVIDTGIGMSKDYIDHIFEPFTREGTTTVSGIEGTGLGMSITKNIVDMMNGDINIKSAPHKGTEVKISLTMKISENSPRTITPLPEFEGSRALVVDDFMDTCANISRMLSNIGLLPDWTTSGKEAVFKTQCAFEDGKPFDVFIIDWQIPDMNGIEVTRQIRSIVGSDIPVIILTAYDWTEIEDEAYAAGVTAFCPKPVFMTELSDILHKVASGRTENTVGLFVERNNFEGHRVLLVEDNIVNREIATDLLNDVNVEVEHAHDGNVAIEMVKSHEPGYYDLILMDIQMPIMNGYDACRAIRKLDDEEKANIPIIAMTADAFDEDKQAAFDAGMNSHIAKPIEIPLLMDELYRYFQIKN